MNTYTVPNIGSTPVTYVAPVSDNTTGSQGTINTSSNNSSGGGTSPGGGTYSSSY